MPKWDYPSYDVDSSNSDDYTCRTDFLNDGTVHRYEAINGRWENGHTHAVYNSKYDYYNNNPSWKRSESASKERPWDNRYFAIEALMGLSFAQLQYVEAISNNDYIKRTARHFMQNAIEMPLDNSSLGHNFRR